MKWTHAIITGAGSGLGHGIAIRLLKRGTLVSALDLAMSPERAALLDAAAQQGGVRWQMHQADVTQPEQLRDAFAGSVAAFGPPGLALNCAGVGIAQSFADMSDATFRRVIEINLMGSYNFARAAIPHLLPGARLALIASMAGITSNYGYSAYGTSKFGVIGLATSLRYEYEPLGLRISCICPPEVKTPMVEEEYRSGNPIALELKQIAGSLEADPAIDGILAGLDAGKWMIIPGAKARLTAFAATRLPGTFQAITGMLIRRIMRKHGMRLA